MEIGKNVITAGVVLIIGLVIYIMVTNTIAAFLPLLIHNYR